MADVSVRPAAHADVPAIAEVQLAVWRTMYAGLLPAAALDGLDPEAVQAGWYAAVDHPPHPLARVLVAVEGGAVVGLAAVAPAADDDLDPDRWGEVTPPLVLPPRRRAGHGSRLLAAATDVLREGGRRYAVSWVYDGDATTVRFLEAAGWALDGAVRTLDAAGTPVREVRLHTEIGD